MSYGFEVYDDARNSVIPQFVVVDAFTITPGESLTKVYADAPLAKAVNSGVIKITLFEAPTIGPTMVSKPIQATKYSFVEPTPVLTPLSAYDSGLQSRIQQATTNRNYTIAGINAGINYIYMLASKYGLTLGANDSSVDPVYRPAIFEVTSAGYFHAEYNSIYDHPENWEPFRNAFYAAGGAWEQTYGKSALLETQTNALAALMNERAANPPAPRTETGQTELALKVRVQDGNMQSRIIVLASGAV